MNAQIGEAASEWLIKHREGDLSPQEQKEFGLWLRQSPEHVQVYLELSAVWEDVGAADPARNPCANELVALAREQGNVVSLDLAPRYPAQVPVRMRGRDAGRRQRLWYGIAASILLAVLGGWLYLQRGVYSTEIGEQRSLVLEDGSTIELNSRSRIRVHYTQQERRVSLLEGQALFRVARNKVRPFVVLSGNSRVRAVGTEFDVYEASSGTVVTVLEGSVAVHGTATTSSKSQGAALGTALPARSPKLDISGVGPGSAEVLLSAGEQLVITPAAFTTPQRADVSAATAWTRRSLVFDSAPLSLVAREFNRYNTRQLVVDDGLPADFLVSGVFSSADPTLLLRFLTAQPDLVVVETQTQIHVRHR